MRRMPRKSCGCRLCGWGSAVIDPQWLRETIAALACRLDGIAECCERQQQLLTGQLGVLSQLSYATGRKRLGRGRYRAGGLFTPFTAPTIVARGNPDRTWIAFWSDDGAARLAISSGSISLPNFPILPGAGYPLLISSPEWGDMPTSEFWCIQGGAAPIWFWEDY